MLNRANTEAARAMTSRDPGIITPQPVNLEEVIATVLHSYCRTFSLVMRQRRAGLLQVTKDCRPLRQVACCGRSPALNSFR